MSVKAVTTVSMPPSATSLRRSSSDSMPAVPPGPPGRGAGFGPDFLAFCGVTECPTYHLGASGQSLVTSSSSRVRTGPVYLFFADTAHQIATIAPTTSTIGV